MAMAIVEGDMEVVFDWMQFTVQGVFAYEVVQTLFKVSADTLLHTPSGRFGYNNTVTYGEHILIMWHDTRFEMGVHVLLSGMACRYLESILSWDTFISRIHEFESVKYTRIDVAIDCFKPYFTVGKIREHIVSGNVVSKFKKATYMEQLSIGSGDNESASIKFGSMSSDMYIVFYDKLAERRNAGFEVKEHLDFWTRCELRFKHDLAVKLMSLYMLHDFVLGDYINEILYNYIDFKVNTGKTRKINESTVDWWSDFLGVVTKLQIAPKASDTTIDRKIVYARKQFSKLSVMIKAVRNDFFDELLREGVKKLKPSDLEVVNAHLISIGQTPVDCATLIELIQRNDEHYDVHYNDQLRMPV